MRLTSYCREYSTRRENTGNQNEGHNQNEIYTEASKCALTNRNIPQGSETNVACRLHVYFDTNSGCGMWRFWRTLSTVELPVPYACSLKLPNTALNDARVPGISPDSAGCLLILLTTQPAKLLCFSGCTTHSSESSDTTPSGLITITGQQ